jgi:ectoine hydroxylase-related dioxygenase (phytanoyl-CoA dioxygenase family)
MADTEGATALADRHPWNRHFVWRDHVGPFDCLIDEQVAAFDALGYVVLPDLVAADVLGAARDEIDGFEAEVDRFLRTTADGRLAIAETGAITFSPHLVARSERLRALSRDAAILGICRDLVGPDVNLYWDQAVYKKPEKPRRFPWHQDNGYTFIEPQQYLTVWLALTDATVDNGCPWVVPGLHRRGTLAHTYVEPLGYECLEDPPGAVPAEVAAGGAVVFSSLTPHLTGPNSTDAVRKSYILQYAPAGAQVLRGDPAVGPPTHREACDAPDRQYPVLRGGRPVEAGGRPPGQPLGT